MHDLAKECKRLKVFLHVSTAYVHYHLPNMASSKEEILVWNNFEDVVKRMESIDPTRESIEAKQILDEFNFPNTYTLTKNLAEQYLFKNRGNMRCVVLRPSIVISNYK